MCEAFLQSFVSSNMVRLKAYAYQENVYLPLSVIHHLEIATRLTLNELKPGLCAVEFHHININALQCLA